MSQHWSHHVVGSWISDELLSYNRPQTNPNPVTNPLLHALNASFSLRPMWLRRFTVCGLQNSPENRYCNVIIFVFTDMLLAVSGMYQLEKKEERLHPSLKPPGIPPSESITSMNLILLLKGVGRQHLQALVNSLLEFTMIEFFLVTPAFSGFCNADCTSSGSLDNQT